MKKLLSALAVLFLCTALHAQYSRHIIQFKDKSGTGHSLTDPSTYLSAKAVARRINYNIRLDSTDLPIPAAYLDSIAKVPNVVIYNKSKWLNQVLIRTNDPAALLKIRSFSFVKSDKQVATNSVNSSISNSKLTAVSPALPANQNVSPDRPGANKPDAVTGTPVVHGTHGVNDIAATLNYGSSYGQVHIHNGDFLHDKGYTGNGMDIAMMDAGFHQYKTNPMMDSLRLQNRILGEWDFVMNEESVNEDHAHGAFCLSILAANKPGMMVGTAPYANYWLFRTEDVGSETPVEEQNWIAAAEFADSAGAHMLTTSLGYVQFDNPALSYSYAQRDGNTAMITIAADLAAKKGMIVMNSAGNYGASAGDIKYMVVPADGDSVVSVGAVDVNGNIGAFSSWGPNGRGKLKPNIVSVGWGTTYASITGVPVTGSGTSLSNPNIAGLIACLWQAFPRKSNMEIISAVERSSNRYLTPDDRYGYGLPDFKKAYHILIAESIVYDADYKNCVAHFNWSAVDDTSVTYTLERQENGSSAFTAIASFKGAHALLNPGSYSFNDSTKFPLTGKFSYRLRVNIGNDTSFIKAISEFDYSVCQNFIAASITYQSDYSNCVAKFNWSATDDTTVTYSLEKQTTGSSVFNVIATFKGKGYSLASNNYSFIDSVRSPVSGLITYRLRVNINDDTSFIKAISVYNNAAPCYDKQGYFFTPNPFRSELLAMFNTLEASSKLNIILYDISGRLVHRYHGSKPASYHHVRIPTAGLAAGVYVAVIMIDNRIVYKQTIVK
jgi:hypothetical protein